MTEAIVQRALADSIAETLDAMFFTPCLGPPEEGAAPQPELAAQVAFEGKPPGRLTLRVAATAARTIAAGFLGEEEDQVSEARVGEVLCELANMICGSAMSRVESAEEFRLGAPRTLDPGATARPPGAIAHAVETGSGALEAILEMDDLCPPAEKSAS